jgi:hydroxymethylglutaryl-CoA reductase
MTTSRISKFYTLTLDERRVQLADASNLTPDSLLPLTNGLSAEAADHMIENAIGTFALPLGIGLNFMVNGRDVLVPMAIEEPSVVAGASFMAKLTRAGGGFIATTTEPLMIGQMQVINVVNLDEAKLKIYEHKSELLADADSIDPVLKKFGGGARDLEVRIIEDSPIGAFLVVHLIYDVRDDSLQKWNPLPAEKSICAFFPILQIAALHAYDASSLRRNWLSKAIAETGSVTASSPRMLSPPRIHTAPRPITKAS